MIEESPEVEAVIERWFECDNQPDYASMRSLYSDHPATTFIGSDLDEWWVGERVSAIIGEPREQAGLEYHDDVRRIEAYRDGNVGWAAALSKVTVPGREPSWFRDTFVLRLEAAGWRILQSHSSVAVPNTETFGTMLPTSLDELIEVVGVGGLAAVARPDGDTVAIAFTDIVRSTPLSHQLGDRRWAELMSWHDRRLRSISEEHGGRFVKGLGDGAMLAFGDPPGCLRALAAFRRAALDCPQWPGLPVRVGVHAGRAVDTGGDFAGETVVKAARISDAALGGQILVSEETVPLVDEPDLRFGDPVHVRLRGLEGQHTVFPLA